MQPTPTYEPNQGIELLHTRDCRAWPEALKNLAAALKKLGLAEEPRLVTIDTLDQAHAYQFFASPTIHVNGIDIDPKGRRVSRRALGSGRPYFYAGQASSAPPTKLIIEGLRELYFGAEAEAFDN